MSNGFPLPTLPIVELSASASVGGAPSGAPPARTRRLPPWLKRPLPAQGMLETRQLINGLKLNTVCVEARCPNLTECWSRHTATFMILGDKCTRNCHFCAVHTARPDPVDTEEPARLAEAAAHLRLRHVVITSVARDDLPDEGAGHFAACIRAVHERLGAAPPVGFIAERLGAAPPVGFIARDAEQRASSPGLSRPGVTVEVLVPDFHARADCIATVLAAAPEVFNHNVETVPRLHKPIRPQAKYPRSLETLRLAKQRGAQHRTRHASGGPGAASASGVQPHGDPALATGVHPDRDPALATGVHPDRDPALATGVHLDRDPALATGVHPDRDPALAGGVRIGASGALLTKSGVMVGLGETHAELLEVFRDLRSVGCDLLTIGQYLKPSSADARHAPVVKYYTPAEFDELGAAARALGFAAVASGPFVRSSYFAETLFRDSGAASP